MNIYQVNEIDDYQNRLTDEQKHILIQHCNNYGIFPDICAWYDNLGDFYTDWVNDNAIFKDSVEAFKRYEEGSKYGEFLTFNDGQIVRLVV